MQVAPAASVTAGTWIVMPETPTAPHVEAVNPALVPVVDGADQPEATVTAIRPALRPPGGAV